MGFELTTQEKVDILKEHIKNVYVNEYSLYLNIKQQNIYSDPNQAVISSLNLQLKDICMAKEMLENELNLLEMEANG